MSIAEQITELNKKIPQVYEKGKEYFVKPFTNNGNRTYYMHAFRTCEFYEDNNIDFKGLCKPVLAAYMLYNQIGTHIPIGIDLSNINTASNDGADCLYCWSSNLLEIPDYNMPTPSRYYVTYGYCRALHTIHGKVRTNENTTFTNIFRECNALQNMEIEGTIGQNGFNVQWSTKLSGASIVSIIEALSETTSGLTVTLSQTAVDAMTFPITGKLEYTSWDMLVNTKTNWTVSLV